MDNKAKLIFKKLTKEELEAIASLLAPQYEPEFLDVDDKATDQPDPPTETVKKP